ncbi:hypothetical protein ACWCWD_11225 [Streptomyces sp. NPDC001493]
MPHRHVPRRALVALAALTALGASACTPDEASPSRSGDAAPVSSAPAGAPATAASASPTASPTPSPTQEAPEEMLAVLHYISATAGGHSVAYRPAVFCPLETMQSFDDCRPTMPADGVGFVATADPKEASDSIRPLEEDASVDFYVNGNDVRIGKDDLVDADAHGGIEFAVDFQEGDTSVVRLTFAPSGSIASIEGVKQTEIHSDITGE